MSITLSKTLKITAAAAAIAIAGAALPGFAAPAEAKKLVIVKKTFHKGFHRHGVYLGSGLLLASGGYYAYRSCYWLKVRALETGRDYWWDRYHDCKGD